MCVFVWVCVTAYRLTGYCVSALVLSLLGLRFRKRWRPSVRGKRRNTNNRAVGVGSVGGGAANAVRVRQCCQVVTVASTRRLRPVSVHVAGVFFLHSQPRRTQIRRQCDRLMSIPELSGYQSIYCKL